MVEGERNVGKASKVNVILDATAVGLLLVWTLLALAGLTFGQVIGEATVDIAALVAFGSALCLVALPRWLRDVSDKEMIGPFRLWVAACMAALLFCMASSFIATPRMREIKSQIVAHNDLSAERMNALLKSLAKVKNFSVQFLCIRMVLAVGITIGTKKLPACGLNQTRSL